MSSRPVVLLFAVVLVTSLSGIPLAAGGAAPAADQSAGTAAELSADSAGDLSADLAGDLSAHTPDLTAGPTAASAPGSAGLGDVAPAPDGEVVEREDVEYVGDADEPTTSETLGYVEGYHYDDELPVDDRTDGVVADDELDAVVYRSMARVEVLRELPFEEPVPVDVITRETFSEEEGVFVDDPSPEERLFHNVRFEALFMVDGETDAVDEFEALYDASVLGYYDPQADEIVLVSDDLDEPAVDEPVLGHELLHALQDQHFDLTSFERETRDQATATEGLIEGDAVWVDTEYEDRCGVEWGCVTPATDPAETPPTVNYGQFLTVYHPYSDGPHYVESLLERGGWDAVDAAYEEPPNSSSEVIRPGEVREPVDVELSDRSTDDWERLAPDDGPASDRFGEATVAAAFMYQTSAVGAEVGVPDQALVLEMPYESFDYDHPVTDGWAGDEIHAYAAADADVDDGELDDEGLEAVDTGYVWRSEWTSADDAAAFVDGYESVLEANGAEAVADDVYDLDDSFAGAVAVDREGSTVTIVNAPDVDALDEVYDGVGADATADGIPGFGVAVGAAAIAILVAAGAATAAARRR